MSNAIACLYVSANHFASVLVLVFDMIMVDNKLLHIYESIVRVS